MATPHRSSRSRGLGIQRIALATGVETRGYVSGFGALRNDPVMMVGLRIASRV